MIFIQIIVTLNNRNMLQSISKYYYPKLVQVISTVFNNNNIKKNESMSFDQYLQVDDINNDREFEYEYGNGYGQFTYLDMQKMMFQNTYPKKPAKMIQTLPTICEDLEEILDKTEYDKFMWRQFMLFGMILTVSGYILVKGTF